MFRNVFSSSLSVQQALELANLHLENAHNTKDPELVLTCCNYAETTLSRMKTVAKKTVISSSRADHQALRSDVAAAFFEHGKLLDSLGNHTKAQASYKKAEKWG
ncbi:hypothetical protein EDD21DRAFT_352310 [Dissophora ornata]|nr:hypothetical protein EDD21DRAFT_352310 [Dissophora ornata]